MYNAHPVVATKYNAMLYGMTPDGMQQNHERTLQQQEQQRRMYDSETARQSQQQKFGVLGGLLGGNRISIGGR